MCSTPITSLRNVQQNEQTYFILDNNLSPCSECCILSCLGDYPVPEFYVPMFWNALF